MPQPGNEPSESESGRQIGPYRILERIGRGGMGEVFRGWDTKLGRPVAVKALPPALSGDATARRRFVRETRLACRVVHPYVATVFDVVEHETRLYLVMEYIEGRRFDDYLHEAETGPRDVTRFGLEIAEALAAIHRAGLVHRDLKPANVMVTPAGHVKVMDFGVAFPVRPPEFVPDGSTEPTEQRLTGEGFGVGTISYMAPEQIRGQAVDPRSDLFALGIVLYEAITGEHPFMRESLLATASAILNEPPGTGPEPQSLTNSGPLRQVVLRLLEKDPARRYQTSDAVVADLRAVAHGEPLVERPARDRSVLRAVAWTLLAVVGVASAGYGLYRARQPKVAAVEARPVVAVLPFEDRTAERDEDRGRMVTDLLGASLGETGIVRPLGTERVEELLATTPAPSSRADARRIIARFASVGWIVSGTVYRQGDSYQAAVEVYSPDSSSPVGSFEVAAAGTAGLIDLARVRLLAILAPHVRTKTGTQLSAAKLSSGSEEARVLSERARRAVRELRYLDAIALLEKAVAIDPVFASAHARLADALDAAGYGRRAREASDRATRLVEGPGGPPSERIGLEVRATTAKIRARFGDELDARRALVDRFPDEPEGLRALSAALIRNAKFEEALAVAERALSLDPQDPRSQLLRAQAFFYLRRADDADAALRTAADTVRAIHSVVGVSDVEVLEANIRREFHSDLRGAAALYRAAAERLRRGGLAARAAEPEQKAADTEVYLGNFSAAEALYRTSIDTARAEGEFRLVVNVLNGEGATLLQRGDLQAAERVMRQALDEVQRLENPDLMFPVCLNLASLLQFAGRLDEGRAYAERGLHGAREGSDKRGEITARLILADVAYQQGRLLEAVQAYDDVLSIMIASSEAKERVGFARAGIAQVLETLGRTEQALAAADLAVESSRAQKLSVDLGYFLVVRAGIRGELALWDEAGRDLAEAETLAGARGSRIEDLAARVTLVRGSLSWMRGLGREADRPLSEARAAGARLGTVGLEVPALIVSCRVARALQQPREAMAYCREAVERPKAMAFERVEARAALAGTLATMGRDGEAAKEAGLALEEADRMQIPRVAAEAAGILASLPEKAADAESLRQRGRRAFEAYVAAAPKDRREALRARADLQVTLRALERMK